MSFPESEEHKKLKGIFKDKLSEWFKGIVLKEYMVAGYEADVYGVIDGKIVHVEIIWSAGQYGKNMVSLLISDAHIKIAVFGPAPYKKFAREYTKVRVDQSKKGFFFSNPFEGERLLAGNAEYFEFVHKEIQEALAGLPEMVSASPRFYWYVNERLVETVAKKLGDGWEKFPVLSQIALINKNNITDLEDVGDHELGFRTPDLEPVYIQSLTWLESQKVLRFFGRFNTPFGVKEETVTQFLMDPCYFRHKEPYAINIHIKPEFVRSGLEDEGLLGVERWQKPSIFVIGLLRQPELWQPLIIEPLVMYTSDQEKHDFHLALIERTGTLERMRTYFDQIYDKYGMEKAQKLEEIIDNEIIKVLMENCWQNQQKAWELSSLYEIVTKLIVKKNYKNAIYEIISTGYFIDSHSKLYEQFQNHRKMLGYLKETYGNVIAAMLGELSNKFEVEELFQKEFSYYDLILRIMKEGKITIQKIRRTQGFFVIAKLSLLLDTNKPISLKIPDDFVDSLKRIAVAN